MNLSTISHHLDIISPISQAALQKATDSGTLDTEQVRDYSHPNPAQRTIRFPPP